MVIQLSPKNNHCSEKYGTPPHLLSPCLFKSGLSMSSCVSDSFFCVGLGSLHFQLCGPLRG